MPYYRQGDYYRAGDPGFFSFLGRGLKAGLGLLGLGGGGVSKTTSAALGKAATGLSQIASRIGNIPTLLQTEPSVPVIRASPALIAPGAMTLPGGGAALRTVTGHRKCKHVNPRTGKCIRRMRVTNTKALRRAIHRAEGFAHLAKRVLRFTSPRPPKGRAVFKKRKRARRV